MDTAIVWQFIAAVFFLLITPGPGVLSTAGVGSGYGYRAGSIYVGGLFVGTNLVALAVVGGLAAAIFAVPGLRLALMAASTAYLLYLAAKIALAGAKVAFIHAEAAPGFSAGIALQLINPKAYAVNTSLFSGFAFAQGLGSETVLKFLIINAIWVPIHFLWLWFGVTVRRLDLPVRMQRGINVGMALAMLATVGLAVAAQL